MRLLLTLAVRNLWSRKGRTVLTAFGIALGIAAVLAVNITNASLLASFNAVFDEAGGRAQLAITSRSRGGGEGFDLALLRTVRGIEGVVAAAPSAQAISLPASERAAWEDTSGPTGVGAGMRLVLMGIDAEADPTVRDYELVAGRFLEARDRGYSAVLVDAYAAEQGVGVGDDLALLSPAGLFELRVIGLVAQRGAGVLNGGAVAFVPRQVVDDLTGRADSLDRIDVVTTRAIADSPEALAAFKARVEAEVAGADVRVDYPGARGEELSKRMTSYNLGLDMFSLVSMVVGGFLIYNTFAMGVAERTRAFGVLRAIALTRTQVLAVVLIEALALALVGSALGVAIGLGMAAGMSSFLTVIAGSAPTGMDIQPAAFTRSLGLGLIVTLLSAFWPAWSASRVTPIEAIKSRAHSGASGWTRLGWKYGPALLALGYLVFMDVPLRPSVAFSVVNVAMLVFLGGAALVAGGLFRPLSRWLGGLSGVYGFAGRIGAQNLGRSEGRVIVTVASLMLGIAMSIGTTALGRSFRYELGRWVEAATGGDLIVQSAVRLNPTAAQRLKTLPGVALLTPERSVEVYHSGERTGDQADELVLVAIEPETRREISSFIFVQTPPGGAEAAFDRLEQGGALFVASGLASRYGLKPGDAFTLDTPRGTQAFEVAGEVVDFNGNGLMVYAGWDDLVRYFGVRDADRYILTAEPGVAADTLAETIQTRLGERLNLSIDTVRELLAAVYTITDQSFALFDTLAFIMVAVSAAGVINTMTISVLERGKEIATLRSLGFTRGQVRQMVLGEALLIGLLGGGLGLLLGLLTARMFVRVIEVLAGYSLTFLLPMSALISSTLIALVISQLSALWPAWQAAGRGIIEALKDDS